MLFTESLFCVSYYTFRMTVWIESFYINIWRITLNLHLENHFTMFTLTFGESLYTYIWRVNGTDSTENFSTSKSTPMVALQSRSKTSWQNLFNPFISLICQSVNWIIFLQFVSNGTETNFIIIDIFEQTLCLIRFLLSFFQSFLG